MYAYVLAANPSGHDSRKRSGADQVGRRLGCLRRRVERRGGEVRIDETNVRAMGAIH